MIGHHRDTSRRAPMEEARDAHAALNSLQAMLELLGFSQLDGEQRQILESARDSARGLARIIENVLDHAASVVAPVSVPDEGRAVLVVDDHPTNRGLLARQLAMLGLRVQTAADGPEALAQWRSGGCLLVITDCYMPGMDGYALSRAIREIEEQEGRSRTPIIAWTGNALPSATAQCRVAGMDDILSKPTRLGALKALLSKWLGTPATAAAGPLCVAELESLAESAAERTEILHDFVDQARSDLADLETALKVQDLSASVRIVHRLKGASRMVGARDLAAACETVEHSAAQGSPAGVAAATMVLTRAVELLVAQLADVNQEAL